MYRVLVRFAARRYRPVPFQDGWMLFGISLLAAAFLLKLLIRDDVAQSLAAFAVLEVVCLLASFRMLWASLRQLFRASAPAPVA